MVVVQLNVVLQKILEQKLLLKLIKKVIQLRNISLELIKNVAVLVVNVEISTKYHRLVYLVKLTQLLE
ncbi:hypothetical protein SDC9_118768 [bioreactor metagenome]|uniref:Uncharacterized protein n=1 Tax=bioreactor metagenome TaxID=1076179 RepID=A0A645C3L3_9ZZZZ